MTAVADRTQAYVDQFEQVVDTAVVPADVRRAAFERFGKLGFPTMRHEDWRFTNTRAITETVFGAATPRNTADIRAFVDGQIIDADWPRLVFVNGHFSAELSSPEPCSGPAWAGALTAMPPKVAGAVQPHLARYADCEQHAFTALNTAFLSDGAVVHVPAGSTVDRPIHVLHVSVPGAEPQVSHPRGLIVVETGGELTVIESFVGDGAGSYFTNCVTEIVAADNTHIDHYKVVFETPEAYHVGTTRIHMGRDSTVTSHTITLGGKLVRNDITTVLDGEGGTCTLNGLYIVNDRNHVDNHLRVEHAKPHCDSREYFKGILDDHARAVFTGRIIVHKDAQKTDAKQTNMNLLLSDDCQVDTKPQLEIFADDVKCTHGATIGQLDADAMFYLKSRGIDEVAARGVLLFAFAQASIDQVTPEPLRDRLQDALYDLIPGGHLLREKT